MDLRTTLATDNYFDYYKHSKEWFEIQVIYSFGDLCNHHIHITGTVKNILFVPFNPGELIRGVDTSDLKHIDARIQKLVFIFHQRLHFVFAKMDLSTKNAQSTTDCLSML